MGEKKETGLLEAHTVEFMREDERHIVAIGRKDDTFQCEFIKWNKEGTLRQSTALLLGKEVMSAVISIVLKHHAEYFVNPPPPAPKKG